MVARPARLGMLVEAELKGVHWLRMFEGALAAQSRFWGGQGNLLFPLTKDFTDYDLFWALSDIFDADAFVSYAPTWSEMEDIAPEVLERKVSAWRRQITDKAGADQAESFISRSMGEAAYHPEIPKNQIDLMRKDFRRFHTRVAAKTMSYLSGSTGQMGRTGR